MNEIKKYRILKKMTIRELSNKAHVAIGYLSDLENNKFTNPTKTVMDKISKALGQTVPEVFFPNESKEVAN